MSDPQDLKIRNIIGFNGSVFNSLTFIKNNNFILYPLGPFLALKNCNTGIVSFMDGHTEGITCVAVNKQGTVAATGQSTLPGRTADIRVWDITKAIELNKSEQTMIGDDCQMLQMMSHLGKVQGVSFSPSGKYLLSIGGQDDNQCTIWDVSTGEAVCGAQADKDTVFTCSFLNKRDDRFVTGGEFHARVWQIDFKATKLHVMNVKLGNVRRYLRSIAIDPDDKFAYCGTDTGDILKLSIDRDEMKSYNDPDTIIPSLAGITKDRYPGGVNSIVCVKNIATGNTNLLIGSGDGTLCYVNTALRTVNSRKTKVLGGVTSITMAGSEVMIGTDQCNKYTCTKDLKNIELIESCHHGAINTLTFPEGSSDLLLTTSTNDLRVWHIPSTKELLRVQVPTQECMCCEVTATGSAIISGWSDGKIRSFSPQTGKSRFIVADAHNGEVSALAIAGDDSYAAWQLVSGGSDGTVRVWTITYQHQVMVASLKEHRGRVNAIKVNADQTEAVSACADGSCIVWCLKRYVRLGAFMDSNVFTCLAYHPDESQMLTGGTNCKVTYWDSVDGTAIRELEVVEGDTVNSVDVTQSGTYFVSGSGRRTKQLSVVQYDEGLTIAVGKGHAGAINAVKFSPDMQCIASVGSTGEVIIWDTPTLDLEDPQNEEYY